MSTGENEQGLRAITDFTRLMSVAVLLIHFYIFCHPAMICWGLNAPVVDRVMANIARLPVFDSAWSAKAAAVVLLIVFLMGIKGKKNQQISLKTAMARLIPGLILYMISNLFLYIPANLIYLSVANIGVTAIGYLLMIAGGTLLSRILKLKLQQDIFNKLNESFPQEERLLENEYSINFPAQYHLKGKIRKSSESSAQFNVDWIRKIHLFGRILSKYFIPF